MMCEQEEAHAGALLSEWDDFVDQVQSDLECWWCSPAAAPFVRLGQRVVEGSSCVRVPHRAKSARRQASLSSIIIQRKRLLYEEDTMALLR
jgi:hypothetical protein